METNLSAKMEEQFDAVLYLGPESSITMSDISAALCADAEYTRCAWRAWPSGPGPPERMSQGSRHNALTLCIDNRSKAARRADGMSFPG